MLEARRWLREGNVEARLKKVIKAGAASLFPDKNWSNGLGGRRYLHRQGRFMRGHSPGDM